MGKRRKRKAKLLLWFTRKKLLALAAVFVLVGFVVYGYCSDSFSQSSLDVGSSDSTVTPSPTSSGGVDYWSESFSDEVVLSWSQDSDYWSVIEDYSGSVSGPEGCRVFLVSKYISFDVELDSSDSGFVVEPVIAPDPWFGEDDGEEGFSWFLLCEGVTDSSGVYSFEYPFFDEEYGLPAIPGVISTMVLASDSDCSGADVSMWLSARGNVFSDAELADASFIVSSNIEVFTLVDDGFLEF